MCISAEFLLKLIERLNETGIILYLMSLLLSGSGRPLNLPSHKWSNGHRGLENAALHLTVFLPVYICGMMSNISHHHKHPPCAGHPQTRQAHIFFSNIRRKAASSQECFLRVLNTAENNILLLSPHVYFSKENCCCAAYSQL